MKPLILLLKHGRQGPRLESYKQEDELVLDDKEEWKINLSGCIINDDGFCLTVSNQLDVFGSVGYCFIGDEDGVVGCGVDGSGNGGDGGRCGGPSSSSSSLQGGKRQEERRRK